MVFTIWAVFGGFILHFLLCNYLTVLLRPSYEEPVETAADLIERDITPFMAPRAQIFRQFFAASPDPDYQEISRRLVVAKDWDEYEDMIRHLHRIFCRNRKSTRPFVGTRRGIQRLVQVL